jgi:MFS family permease
MSNTSAPHAARGALAALSLCMLLPSLGTSIVNVALPRFTEEFGASYQQVQWVVVAYLLANTALIVGVGRLGDRIGRRRLLVAGLVVFTGASLLCGVAPGLWQLVAARALQGVGAAALIALAMALVGETVGKERTGRTMGLLGTMSAIGTALGPSMGGVLVAGFGWPAIFFVNLPLAALALFLVGRHLPRDRRAAAQVSAAPWTTTLRADPALVGGLAMTALVSTVVMATLVVGPFHLTNALGLGVAGVGLAMSAGPIVSALTGLPAGRLVDRLGTSRTTAAGLVGMATGCLALALVPVSWGIAGYVVPLVILTAHYALFQAANNTAVMKDVPADRRGAVSGMLNLSRNLGLMAGASLMGGVHAHAGMQATFVLATGLVAVALLAAIGMSSQRKLGSTRIAR